MSKRYRSVGDWPEVNRRSNKSDINNKAFDSMLNITESDTLWSKDGERISSVQHKLDDGGSIKEKWFDHPKAENVKTRETEIHGERSSTDGPPNVARQSIYYEDGSIKGEITYNTDAELRTVKEYYPDGSIKRDTRALGSDEVSKHHITRGNLTVNPQGIISSSEYYPDGSVARIEQGNEQGVRVGKQERYWPNGNVRHERNYDDQGRNHGTHVKWKPDGSMSRKTVWDHGRLVSRTRHSKEEIDKINKSNAIINKFFFDGEN